MADDTTLTGDEPIFGPRVWGEGGWGPDPGPVIPEFPDPKSLGEAVLQMHQFLKATKDSTDAIREMIEVQHRAIEVSKESVRYDEMLAKHKERLNKLSDEEREREWKAYKLKKERNDEELAHLNAMREMGRDPTRRRFGQAQDPDVRAASEMGVSPNVIDALRDRDSSWWRNARNQIQDNVDPNNPLSVLPLAWSFLRGVRIGRFPLGIAASMALAGATAGQHGFRIPGTPVDFPGIWGLKEMGQLTGEEAGQGLRGWTQAIGTGFSLRKPRTWVDNLTIRDATNIQRAIRSRGFSGEVAGAMGEAVAEAMRDLGIGEDIAVEVMEPMIRAMDTDGGLRLFRDTISDLDDVAKRTNKSLENVVNSFKAMSDFARSQGASVQDAALYGRTFGDALTALDVDESQQQIVQNLVQEMGMTFMMSAGASPALLGWESGLAPLLRGMEDTLVPMLQTARAKFQTDEEFYANVGKGWVHPGLAGATPELIKDLMSGRFFQAAREAAKTERGKSRKRAAASWFDAATEAQDAKLQELREGVSTVGGRGMGELLSEHEQLEGSGGRAARAAYIKTLNDAMAQAGYVKRESIIGKLQAKIDSPDEFRKAIAQARREIPEALEKQGKVQMTLKLDKGAVKELTKNGRVVREATMDGQYYPNSGLRPAGRYRGE